MGVGFGVSVSSFPSPGTAYGLEDAPHASGPKSPEVGMESAKRLSADFGVVSAGSLGRESWGAVVRSEMGLGVKKSTRTYH